MNDSRSDKWVEIGIYIILGIVLAVVLYPLYFVLIASFSEPLGVLRGEVWLLPKDITWTGYERIFQNAEIINSYLNTILYTCAGTALNLVLTVAGAYPLSRKDFAGRRQFTAIIVFTMFFSGGLVPSYLLVMNLGLMNSMWALIVPFAVSVWNLLIMRTFFETSVPNEIQEASWIDGCSNLQTLVRIVLPLSLPILAVMTLFYSVGHWNSYFSALIYLSDREKYPLQLILREILLQGQMQDMIDFSDESIARNVMNTELIKYAAVIVANVPVLVLYPFLQKYFVKGVMIGAIKG